MIVKQPNGKYAVFSNNVEDFLLYDASKKEVIDYLVKRHCEEYRNDLETNFEIHSSRTSFLNCLDKMVLNHTVFEVETTLTEMGILGVNVQEIHDKMHGEIDE